MRDFILGRLIHEGHCYRAMPATEGSLNLIARHRMRICSGRFSGIRLSIDPNELDLVITDFIADFFKRHFGCRSEFSSGTARRTRERAHNTELHDFIGSHAFFA